MESDQSTSRSMHQSGPSKAGEALVVANPSTAVAPPLTMTITDILSVICCRLDKAMEFYPLRHAYIQTTYVADDSWDNNRLVSQIAADEQELHVWCLARIVEQLNDDLTLEDAIDNLLVELVTSKDWGSHNAPLLATIPTDTAVLHEKLGLNERQQPSQAPEMRWLVKR